MNTSTSPAVLGDHRMSPELLDLMEHEKVIEQGLASFIDVGIALLAIKANKKYRHAGYSSFEDYCDQRWNISRQYGNRLAIAASTAQSVLTPMGVNPETERQVRPLTLLKSNDERREAWAEAVEMADGGQPTAAEVEQAVAKHREPRVVPKPIVAEGVPPHPATYPAAVITLFRELIPTGSKVLDPFAGVGTIHKLRPECDTYGIEIESEWAAAHPDTVHGDARYASNLDLPSRFDVISTSPAYGNRLADWYQAADPEARRSYAIDLGHELSDGSGAGVEFATDGEYERLHIEVWSAVVPMLRRGGLFLLNCKDFARDGEVMPVTGWHLAVLADLGLQVFGLRCLPAAGLPFASAKPLSELVVVMRKS